MRNHVKSSPWSLLLACAVAWAGPSVAKAESGSGMEGPRPPAPVTRSRWRACFHSLALRADGTVWTWGFDVLSAPGGSNHLVPVQVSEATNAVAIAAGGDFSLVLRGDGTVLSWGYQSLGHHE